MAKKINDPIIKVNPFLLRNKANKLFGIEYIEGDKSNKNHPMYFNSKTDKEAYRVTLASMRSATLQSDKPSSSGQYGFPAGTSLDMIRKYDDSYFRRPDLTLADIDIAIRQLKELCENLDEQNKANIQADIEKAESIRSDLEAKQNASNNTSSVSGNLE